VFREQKSPALSPAQGPVADAPSWNGRGPTARGYEVSKEILRDENA
jgi:hypothetical protein